MKVLSIFGTRPEAIKFAPVLAALRQVPAQEIQSSVCVTGQHRHLLDQMLSLFQIHVDHDLDVMTADQTPGKATAAILERLDPILRAEQPDWVLVQGDTTTATAASLAAFYNQVKVGHIEAGLRSGDKWQPFPEEANRRVIDCLADLFFAATQNAAEELRREGVVEEQIVVTGNPGIDSLFWAMQQPVTLPPELDKIDPQCKLVLVTMHRRENLGQPMAEICQALRTLTTHYGDAIQVVLPVHLNPHVRSMVQTQLADIPQVLLCEPLGYLHMVHLLKQAYLVLTDSGGLQEEAPSLGKPVLVLRDCTERPEGVAAGVARLVGTSAGTIVREVSQLIDSPHDYDAMAYPVMLYGDGHASRRIVAALQGVRRQAEPVLVELTSLTNLPPAMHGWDNDHT